MYKHFNVQNICLYNLLVCLRFDFKNVRREAILKYVVEATYEHIQG
jgi:hypothetical protein